MSARPTAAAIERSAATIDPAFRDSPQFLCTQLSEELSREVILKVETLNPIRSFKGRGADLFVRGLPDDTKGLVCASAGNFGQGLAYAAGRRGVDLEVFAATNASEVKLDRIRALGAQVTLAGDDFDAAKAAARTAAEQDGRCFVEDGREPAITEGAGSIAVELGDWSDPLDAVVVPVGNGALINGVGRWLKARRPATRVVGISPDRAPAMAQSWRSGTVVETAAADTVADGVAVRVPVPDAVDQMRDTTDAMHLVTEEAILAALRAIARTAGLLVEPSGAVALAGLRHVPGDRVAVVLTGANLTLGQAARWLSDG